VKRSALQTLPVNRTPSSCAVTGDRWIDIVANTGHFPREPQRLMTSAAKTVQWNVPMAVGMNEDVNNLR